MALVVVPVVPVRAVSVEGGRSRVTSWAGAVRSWIHADFSGFIRLTSPVVEDELFLCVGGRVLLLFTFGCYRSLLVSFVYSFFWYLHSEAFYFQKRNP